MTLYRIAGGLVGSLLALALLAPDTRAQVACPPSPPPLGAPFTPTPIPCLPNATTPNGTEVIPGYQNGREVKLTTAQIWQAVLSVALPTRSVAAGTSDAPVAGDFTIKWTSAAASAKTENIPACSTSLKGTTYIIKDGAGTAAVYPITLMPASGTVDGAVSYAMTVNRQAVLLQCDGGSDWTIL
jgi:hypothetical protein